MARRRNPETTSCPYFPLNNGTPHQCVAGTLDRKPDFAFTLFRNEFADNISVHQLSWSLSPGWYDRVQCDSPATSTPQLYLLTDDEFKYRRLFFSQDRDRLRLNKLHFIS